jgi:sugar/nucleoside kinase (ribokinase family)
MTWVEPSYSKTVLNATETLFRSAGGSVANTTVGYAALGGKSGFVGVIGDDNGAEIFSRDLKDHGVEFHPLKSVDPTLKTGFCLVFVTPDSQRTMATYLGASNQIYTTTTCDNWVSSVPMVLFEGYLFEPEVSYHTICKLAKKTKEAGNKVVLSLSDTFCVKRHKEAMRTFINDYVDILMSNEEEAFFLSGTEHIDGAISFFKNSAAKGSITQGSKGAIVFDEHQTFHIARPIVEKVIDSTGCGDQFAAGFLYGLNHNLRLDQAGQLGTFCAGEVITHWGAHPKIDTKEALNRGEPWLISANPYM